MYVASFPSFSHHAFIAGVSDPALHNRTAISGSEINVRPLSMYVRMHVLFRRWIEKRSFMEHIMDGKTIYPRSCVDGDTLTVCQWSCRLTPFSLLWLTRIHLLGSRKRAPKGKIAQHALNLTG